MRDVEPGYSIARTPSAQWMCNGSLLACIWRSGGVGPFTGSNSDASVVISRWSYFEAAIVVAFSWVVALRLLVHGSTIYAVWSAIRSRSASVWFV